MGISTPICLSWTVHNQHEFVQLTLTVKLTTHQLMLNQSSGPVHSWTNRLPSLGWQGCHNLDSIPPFCFALFCRLNSEGTFLVELRKRTSPRQFRVIKSIQCIYQGTWKWSITTKTCLAIKFTIIQITSCTIDRPVNENCNYYMNKRQWQKIIIFHKHSCQYHNCPLSFVLSLQISFWKKKNYILSFFNFIVSWTMMKFTTFPVLQGNQLQH